MPGKNRGPSIQNSVDSESVDPVEILQQEILRINKCIYGHSVSFYTLQLECRLDILNKYMVHAFKLQ